MDELVKKLSEGQHPVEIALRPEKTAAALKKCIDEYAYVHVRFTGTRGGTELGVALDKDQCDWAGADFEAGRGKLRLAGHLTLNFVPVMCIADIDLEMLAGTGHLEVVEAEQPSTAA